MNDRNVMPRLAFAALASMAGFAAASPGFGACTIAPANCQSADPTDALSSDSVNFVAADNFTLSANDVITSLCWRGVYSSAAGADCSGAAVDNFTVVFYPDTGSCLPGAQLFTFTQGSSLLNVQRVATGQLIAGLPEFEFNATLQGGAPIQGGICHWIEIRNALTGDCRWFWTISGAGDSVAIQDGNPLNGYDTTDLVFGNDLAFCLGLNASTLAPSACVCKQTGACPNPKHDCFTPGGPGCSDADCCQNVCAVDPFCCDTMWDGICVGEAATLCEAPPPPCELACPVGATVEVEPNCGIPSDTVNGGCNTAPGSASNCCVAHTTPSCDDPSCSAAVCAVDPFCCTTQWDAICAGEAADLCGKLCTVVPLVLPIACGQTYCGTAAFDGALRDTDWYEITVATETKLIFTVEAEFAVQLFVLDSNCPATALASLAGPACEEVTLNFCAAPGTYRLFVGPQFLAPVQCGANYTATLACGECGCPGTGVLGSFNVDFGSGSPDPANTFGAAAAQPGFWNIVPAFGAGQSFTLCSLAGQGMPGVTISSATANPSFFFDNPGTTGQDHALMDDLLDLGGAGSTDTFTINGLPSGTYEVYTYAWAPDSGTFITSVNVNATGAENVGGAWPGTYQQGITHAKHTVTTTGGPITIATATTTGFSSLNGLQVHKVGGAACQADLFPVGAPDGVVGPGDLGQLLSKWGPCPAPCSADLFPVGAPDGVVGPGDLGQLLSKWGPCP